MKNLPNTFFLSKGESSGVDIRFSVMWITIYFLKISPLSLALCLLTVKAVKVYQNGIPALLKMCVGLGTEHVRKAVLCGEKVGKTLRTKLLGLLLKAILPLIILSYWGTLCSFPCLLPKLLIRVCLIPLNIIAGDGLGWVPFRLD